MPVYDYKCPDHGLFHELATMEDSAKPSACPTCSKLSSRVIMIPPEVLSMAKSKRDSMKRNEEAKHSPIISSLDSRAEAADRSAFAKKHVHKHGAGCSHEHASDQSALKQQVVFLPDGSKVFPSQRPWMISH